MGRYSSVQAYSDQNPNMRQVQITTSSANNTTTTSTTKLKTEKVNNPYGSTAGAGSGEFHVYRHSRQREKNNV